MGKKKEKVIYVDSMDEAVAKAKEDCDAILKTE